MCVCVFFIWKWLIIVFINRFSLSQKKVLNVYKIRFDWMKKEHFTSLFYFLKILFNKKKERERIELKLIWLLYKKRSFVVFPSSFSRAAAAASTKQRVSFLFSFEREKKIFFESAKNEKKMERSNGFDDFFDEISRKKSFFFSLVNLICRDRLWMRENKKEWIY